MTTPSAILKIESKLFNPFLFSILAKILIWEFPSNNLDIRYSFFTLALIPEYRPHLSDMKPKQNPHSTALQI